MTTALLYLLLCAPPDPNCSFTLFAYGTTPYPSHVWGIFQDGPIQFCISWNPAPGQTHVVLHSVTGMNYSHQATLQSAQQRGLTVLQVGPIPCSRQLIQRAYKQYCLLNSGRISYQAIAFNFGCSRANCISALASIPGSCYISGTDFGIRAAQHVARHLWEEDRKR